MLFPHSTHCIDDGRTGRDAGILRAVRPDLDFHAAYVYAPEYVSELFYHRRKTASGTVCDPGGRRGEYGAGFPVHRCVPLGTRRRSCGDRNRRDYRRCRAVDLLCTSQHQPVETGADKAGMASAVAQLLQRCVGNDDEPVHVHCEYTVQSPADAFCR